MPAWGSVLKEIAATQPGGAVDQVRRKYLRQLHRHTGRNVIAYYSGWLLRPPSTPNLSVGDEDMNAFMAAVHQLERGQGLDLILHTPGGDIAATEALVKYLWVMFDKNIRVIVPQLAMSAGTMIACSARAIVMGKQSSLGPIDPQIGGVPAQGVIDEFQMAVQDIQSNQASTPLWQQIVSRYHPSFLLECAQAIKWSREMVHRWLTENMLAIGALNEMERQTTADSIIEFLGNHATTGTHARHIPVSKCEDIGLTIERLEDDPKFQDLVLTVHHAYMHTFSMAPVNKITENHLGAATVLMGAPQPFGRFPIAGGNFIAPTAPLSPMVPVLPAMPAVEQSPLKAAP